MAYGSSNSNFAKKKADKKAPTPARKLAASKAQAKAKQLRKKGK